MNKDIITDLVNKGMSTRQIALNLNISQSNVRYWLNKYMIKTNPKIGENDFDIFNRCNEMVSKNKSLYNYIFGLYLGDGHTYKIKNKKNLYGFCITQDTSYPKLVDEIKKSMSLFFNSKIQIVKREANCYEIKAFSNTIKFLFPKYGVGHKHLNKVYLPKLITDNIDYRSLAKGLFQSDGSYYYNKQNKKYCYIFVNKSSDISEIYIKCLENLGIKYDMNIKNITGVIHVNIRNRENVLKFKNIVGIKE